MPGGSELRIQARIDPRYGWLLVSLRVGQAAGGYPLNMAISTLTPVTAISVATRNLLLPTGRITTVPDKADRYLLRDLWIQDQQLPDLEVGISALAGRAEVSGLLGLDFFARFAQVCVQTPTLEISLLDP